MITPRLPRHYRKVGKENEKEALVKAGGVRGSYIHPELISPAGNANKRKRKHTNANEHRRKKTPTPVHSQRPKTPNNTLWRFFKSYFKLQNSILASAILADASLASLGGNPTPSPPRPSSYTLPIIPRFLCSL
uniref:Uncharacterized protein n=1 Tax=Moniliophthora roreri TaxID=221103 RepID=A0A0W0FDB1_MONRR